MAPYDGGMTMVGSAAQPRLKSLTGLRIFAALVVFVHHVTAYQAVGGFPSFITEAGINGVSFFFILSGFVLAWSSRPDDTVPFFLRRRAARILPLYWIAWLGGVVLTAGTGGRLLELVQQVPGLFLLQSWFPNPAIHFAGNSVGWSLSDEMLFYLVFPVIVPLLRKLGPTGLKVVLGAAVLFVIVIPILLHAERPDGLAYWASYTLPATRFCEFLAGVALSMLIRGGLRIPVSFKLATGLTIAVSIAANWLPFYLTFAAATVVPFLLLIGTAARRDLEGRGTFASAGWIIRLGEWSYAFYLVHLLVLRAAISVNERTLHLPWWALGVLVLAVSVGLSGLLCERIEKPLEARLKGSRRVPATLRGA